MKIVTNLHTQSLTLDDGTVLGAAGHDGSTKSVADLSDSDERLVDRNLISISDAPLHAVSSSAEQTKEKK